MRELTIAVVVTVGALLACKGAEKPAENKAPAAETAVSPVAEHEGKPEAPKPAAKPTGAKAAEEKAEEKADEAKPAADDNGIPEIPEGRSKPPTLAEWGTATEVNTQGEGSRPPGCYMKVVREWLKVQCGGSDWTHADSMEGFGSEQADFFSHEVPHRMFDYVVRLRKGNVMRIKIHRQQGGYAILFMNWPAASARPVHIALGKGGDWH